MSRLAAQMALARLIDRFSDGAGVHATAVPGLTCLKMVENGVTMPTVYTPCLCVIVQGAKQVMLGEELMRYGVGEYLAVSVELPVMGVVTEATRERPYLALCMELDSRILSELLTVGGTMPEGQGGGRGLFVGQMDDGLADAAVRLLRLLETPQDIAVLGPLVVRELHYRLLCSAQGAKIVQIALHGSAMQRIAQVIGVLKRDFKQAIKVEDLAEKAGMSASSFHQHFKEVTAMSPLQYQKQLRLMEARRVMLAEHTTAADAAYRVGYESSSQFSREYVRLFGLPPLADVERLRTA